MFVATRAPAGNDSLTSTITSIRLVVLKLTFSEILTNKANLESLNYISCYIQNLSKFRYLNSVFTYLVQGVRCYEVFSTIIMQNK